MKHDFWKHDLLPVELTLFDGQPNPNTTGALSPEMQSYYAKYLIDLAQPELVHDQFGQKQNIPQGSGKTIQFRRFDALNEVTQPLTEGVTPDGQSLSVKTVESTVKQYGGYLTLSDLLELTAVDNNILQATKLIASQAGRTLDTITREILNAGTVVQYADGSVASRSALAYTSAESNNNLTVAAVKKAVRYLESQDARKIDGYYVGIIHPNVKFDLMSDPEWKRPHEYGDTAHLYRGEIGELYGVRFVESTRAKVFQGAGASGADVYSTLIIADDAYGVTEVEGGGLQHIVKPLGSAGSADPLDQRSTVGWKALRTAEILVPQYLVRIETTATP